MINFLFLAFFFAHRDKACFNVNAVELVVNLLQKVPLSSPSVQTVSCMRCTSCHVTLKNYEFCLDNAVERMKTAAIVNRILILQYRIEESLRG